MTLEQEINKGRRQIATDGYAMSIGELTNLYRDGELDVHPEFQRVYRWTPTQKSRLIESILLGIPLPSIFVAQRDDGVWDVVDGVQRLSTILQLQGLLVDEEKQPFDPLVLESTDLLPSLHGKRWESQDKDGGLTPAQRLDIKRAKMDIKIIKRESDPASKYDLFSRLNTYGSQLMQQEMRNCLLISANSRLFYWLKNASDQDAFRATIALPDRLVEEQFHMELALRFFLFRSIPKSQIGGIGNLHDYLLKTMMAIAEGRRRLAPILHVSSRRACGGDLARGGWR